MKEPFRKLSNVFQFFMEKHFIRKKSPDQPGNTSGQSLDMDDGPSDFTRVRDKIEIAARRKEKRRLAETRKRLARARLEHKGATKTELFAFEEAYDPKARGTIKKIIERQKLKPKLRNPETWTAIHKEMVNEKGEYFNKAYTDLYYFKFPVETPAIVAKKGGPKPTAKPTTTSEDYGIADLESVESEAFYRALNLVHPDLAEDDPRIDAYVSAHIDLGKRLTDKDAWRNTIETYDNAEKLIAGVGKIAKVVKRKAKDALFAALIAQYPNFDPENIKDDKQILDKILKKYPYYTQIFNVERWRTIISETEKETGATRVAARQKPRKGNS